MIPFLQPIKERLSKITPGPWIYHPETEKHYSYCSTSDGEEINPKEVDLQFIASAPTDVEKLIRACELMEEALELIKMEDLLTKPPEEGWYSAWRNITKQTARDVLATVRDMK